MIFLYIFAYIGATFTFSVTATALSKAIARIADKLKILDKLEKDYEDDF